MTKAENRAAAKAYHLEREAERRVIARAEAAKADLAELGRLRHYLIFGLKSSVDRRPLIEATSSALIHLCDPRPTVVRRRPQPQTVVDLAT